MEVSVLTKEVFGWAGKILRVDLSTRKTSTEPTIQYSRGFLGGRGVNSWILYKETTSGIGPFDPANRLIFGTGVLTGTLAPCSCRFTVTARNAFNGALGDANCGGFWAPELKYAGYDHIIIQGRAGKPVYLWIDDEKVEILDAKNTWGELVSETDMTIRDELHDKDIQVVSIGPAGERLVRCASIITSRGRAAGKCGMGAVMGSKNLKAIAVRGTKSVKVADPEKFLALVDAAYERILKDPSVPLQTSFSTAILADVINDGIGLTPYKNFQDSFYPDVDKAGGRVIVEKFGVKSLACFGCPRPCSLLIRINEGEFSGVKTWALEANAIWDWSMRLAITEASAVVKLNQLCNEYGIDIDSSSNVVAWAFDCYEKGILTKEDTNGLELIWGNYQAVIQLVRKLAYREGFGDTLAEGVKRASKKIGRGSEHYAFHVKGMELADPLSAAKGWGFGVVISPRGPCHLRGAGCTELGGLDALPPKTAKEIYGVSTAGNPKTFEGKAQLSIYFERLKSVVDSCGMCYFTSNWSATSLFGVEEYSEFIRAATGWRLNHKDLVRIADRIHNVEKAFNILHGLTRKDDLPPRMFFVQKVRTGPAKGEYVDEKAFNETLDEYYARRGWQRSTGTPKNSTLETLGLKEVARKLKAAGKLA